MSGARFRMLHGWATLVWAGLAVPTVLVWRDSVLWIALMSVWANVVSHWGAWQAARVEAQNGDRHP